MGIEIDNLKRPDCTYLSWAGRPKKPSLKEGHYICCLCGKPKTGYGNDPWPLKPLYGTNNRCCDGCNIYKVVPARMVKK